MKNQSAKSLFLKAVFMFIVTAAIFACSEDDTPGKLKLEIFTSSPAGFQINSALITGEKDAILLDAQFTVSDADNLIEKVRNSGKNLTTIYITHSHPDHYFGLNRFKIAFPDARIVALPSVVADIERTWQTKVDTWKPMYGDQVPSHPIIPDVLEDQELVIEGNVLPIFGNVQGDEADNSYVHIPTLNAVVTGDIVYNGVFPWTLETTPAVDRNT